MMDYFEVASYPDDWKLRKNSIDMIREYVAKVFNVQHHQVYFFYYDGETSIMLNKVESGVGKLKPAELKASSAWIEGFVWGISHR